MFRYLLKHALAIAVTLLFAGAAFAGPTPKARELARKINAGFRQAENISDPAQGMAKLDEITKLMDELKAEDPAYSELAAMQGKYKRCQNTFKGNQATADDKAARQSALDSPERAQALKDWQEFLDVHKSFVKQLDPIIPHGKAVIYEEATVAKTMAVIEALRRQVPDLKTKIEAFTKKYGADRDAIDRKLFALTPKDPAKGMYDQANQRPDGSAAAAVDDLVQRIADLNSAPSWEARRLLTNALMELDGADAFKEKSGRDVRYNRIEKELTIAATLDPADAEIREWGKKVRARRAQAMAELEREADKARFPAAFAGFGGPGSAAELARSVIAYWNKDNAKETAFAAAVAGDWVVAKVNIFNEPIQWGLPVWLASCRNDDKANCRVFRLTAVTKEGRGVKKAPPWDGTWVGNSFQARTKNIPAIK